jgi:hypothetical protein
LNFPVTPAKADPYAGAMPARTFRTLAAVAIVVGGFAGTVSAAGAPPVTGEVDGNTVAVGQPPVPPSTVVEVAVEVAVGQPPVPPSTVVEVAVGRPPVPSVDELESLVTAAVAEAAGAAALSIPRG